MKKLLKKTPLILSILIICFLLVIIVSENFMKGNKKLCYDDIDKIPYNKVGLVLGTSKYLPGNKYNFFYRNRIDAAAELYKSGKVSYLIVSGDNSELYYNEPKHLKEDLIKKDVPPEKIFSDYAGFRTFDSVIRSKEIFGQTKITIISQQFHNERAIFIAKNNDIEAIAYNAKPVTGIHGIKTRIRERFARVKAVLDVHILGTKPKFLGEKIIIK